MTLKINGRTILAKNISTTKDTNAYIVINGTRFHPKHFKPFTQVSGNNRSKSVTIVDNKKLLIPKELSEKSYVNLIRG